MGGKNSHSRVKVLVALARLASFALISFLCLSLFFSSPNCSMGADNLSAVNIRDMSGLWNSDFGLLNFTQEGNRVEGSYSCCNGTITGTIKGNRLDFTWNDPVYGEGWGVFIIQDNGIKLTGKWGVEKNIAKGKWNGTRIREREFKGTPAYWLVTGRNKQVGLLEGNAVLYFSGKNVAGKLEGVYTFQTFGQNSRVEIFNYLKGTVIGEKIVLDWENPGDGSRGAMILRRDNEILQGEWQTSDGNSQGEITFSKPGSHVNTDKIDFGSFANRGIALNKGEELLNKGMDLQQNAEYGEAAELFKKAKTFFEQAGNTAKIDHTDIGLAQCYIFLGRYEDARRLYKEILKKTDDETTRMLAEAGLVMVEVELGVDENSPVVVPGLNKPDDDPVELRMKGFELLKEGQFQDGMEILERSLDGYSLLNNTPGISRNMRNSNLISQGNIRVAMAHACYKEKSYHRAIRQAENGLKIWRQLGAEPNIAQIYSTLGIFYQTIKNFKLSLYYFSKAVAIQKNAGLPGIWQTYYFLAKLHDETGEYRQAKAFFEQSIASIEKLRAGLRTDEAKIGFLSLKIAPFDDFVIFLLEKKPDGNYLLEALEVTERARGRALAELLARKSEYSAPASEPAENNSATAEYSSKPSEYYKKTFDEWFSPLSIIPRKADEIVRFIKQGETAYVVYFVTDPRTFVWLLLPSGEIHLETINYSKKKLAEAVGNLRTDINDGVNQGYNKILFDYLLKPLLTRLQSRMLSCRQMTIIPHDILNSLPFDSLSDSQGHVYPLLEYNITYLPALGIAEQFKPVRLNVDDRILLVGNPRGANLESAEKEVAHVAGLFSHHKKLMGKNADKETVISEINKGYDAVLFSTHGMPDLKNPQMSHLLLADGEKLTLKNITRLKLNTKLVVMSACETHIGKRFGGDELMALTRGFLASGCENVLTTLWTVEQNSASQIIINFFENLKAGLSPAQSLRRSQVRYLENKDIKAKQKRPYYWAPFIVIGSN